MSKKICIAQTKLELKYILSKIRDKTNIVCLPLNLETELYCKSNKINHYRLKNFLKLDFQKRAILANEILKKRLFYGDLYSTSEKESFISAVRFRLNSLIFIIESIKAIKIKTKIQCFYISGWNKNIAEYSSKNYFISKIILELFKKEKIIIINKKLSKINKLKSYSYKLEVKNLDQKKKYALVNNVGYNFFRLILILFVKKYYTLAAIHKEDAKFNIFKKFIYKVLNVKFFYFVKSKNKYKDKIKIPKVKFYYNNINLSRLLNDFIAQQKIYSLSLKSQIQSIDYLFLNTDIKITFSNLSRGISGYLIEKSVKKKINTIYVPHGTVARYYNKYDRIYKKIIADSLFSYKKTKLALQSKIASDFIKYFKIKNKTLTTGNLLFSKSKKILFFKKNSYLLYAVTLKDFFNIQYYGVEMFYEYLDNLNFLNNFAKKNNLKIVVKPHPSEFKSIKDLKFNFKNLIFKNDRIDHLLNNALATISFSSSVIEDSIHSRVPVILLDRWVRYKHCKAETNPEKKNEAIYYINNSTNFSKCINTIKESKKIKFEKYIFKNYHQSVFLNINNLLNKLK